MNAIVQQPRGTALAPRDEAEVLRVMRDALYPGAKEESVRLVLAYCKARGLDPMLKPVHIVPMYVAGQGMRDVPLPGIALYRIQAARTGEYTGKSEPEYGPDETREFHGEDKNGRAISKTVTFPRWCKVTVHRKGKAYTAQEFWLENYATMGRGSEVPNEMWAKRPYGQLAKCAEAQALRQAFPEEIGGEPTAEEMEGKTVIDVEAAKAASTNVGMRNAKDDMVAERLAFRVLFPNGKDKLAGTKADAVAMIVKAAERCADRATLERLIEDNVAHLEWHPGYEPPAWLAEARETIAALRASLPGDETAPSPAPAEREPAGVAPPEGAAAEQPPSAEPAAGGAQPALLIGPAMSEDGIAGKARQRILDLWNDLSACLTPDDAVAFCGGKDWLAAIKWLDENGHARTRAALIARGNEIMRGNA